MRADADDIVLVISQPDRPKGRGKKLEPTPVKALALEHGLTIEQPRKLRDGAVAKRLKALQIDLAIVVAYGRILPKDVFEAPAFNTWNVHASLLPKLRGASPIQHTILNGDTETGVTLMLLSEAMDEGDMLLKRTIAIEPTDTGGSLATRLADVGASTAVEGLRLAKTEGLAATPQDHGRATYARLLEKRDGELDFSRASAELDRQVRAFDPWPGTFVSTPNGAPLKIRGVRPAEAPPSAADRLPGQVVETQPRFLIRTGDGVLEITNIQPPGKRALTAADFLRGAGRTLKAGTYLHEG